MTWTAGWLMAVLLQVFRSELFTMPQRSAAPDGPLDPRLGVSDKVSTCATCK